MGRNEHLRDIAEAIADLGSRILELAEEGRTWQMLPYLQKQAACISKLQKELTKTKTKASKERTWKGQKQAARQL